MKDFLIILKRNFLSPIVIGIFILAITLLALGQNRDALFISVVIFVNTLLGVVQEVRAKNELKKLELMSAPKARRINKDGSIQEIMFDQLLVGDIVQLRIGDEVPADGIIIKSSGLEADESILTGESVAVDKSKDSIVYAASAVVSGEATMRVSAVGLETKVGAMTATLKRYKPQLTPIQKNIWKAISWMSYGAVTLAIIITVCYLILGYDAVQIVRTIASSAATVVPEGLLLASSLLLAYGSIKLAQAKVLPQKLSAIEAMALLDVLCVDKTGTLTSDKITFEKLELFVDDDDSADLIGIVAKETNTGSSTGEALAAGLKAPEQYEILQTLPFSSARKMSGLSVKYNGHEASILIGAPEYVEEVVELDKEQKDLILKLTNIGKRVLLVARFDTADVSFKNISQFVGKAVGIVVLSNELRLGVKKTVSYLQKNGVSIRVISGDNPNTVRYIAKRAGIKNYDKVITGAELLKVSDKDWDKTVKHTTIFARVLPEQKESLIKTFRRLGYFSGMVGDGVNDALAIKKSDLGIAMFAGATATRRVADLILMDNSFNSLPVGMRLGNRIMQAIELIATLFFHKIIYGVVLLVSTLVVGAAYPFGPRHVTFMNIFLVTLPTIMWTLFTPSPRHRISPKNFWRDTLVAISPIALLSGLAVVLTYTTLLYKRPEDLQDISTITVMVATFFGIYLVFLVPKMFDLKNTAKAKLARIFYAVAVVCVVIPSFGLKFARNFFDFTLPDRQNTLPILIMIVCIAIIQWCIAVIVGKKSARRNLVIIKP